MGGARRRVERGGRAELGGLGEAGGENVQGLQLLLPPAAHPVHVLPPVLAYSCLLPRLPRPA